MVCAVSKVCLVSTNLASRSCNKSLLCSTWLSSRAFVDNTYSFSAAATAMTSWNTVETSVDECLRFSVSASTVLTRFLVVACAFSPVVSTSDQNRLKDVSQIAMNE